MKNSKALINQHQPDLRNQQAGLHPQPQVSLWSISVAPSGCRKSTVADMFLNQSKPDLNVGSSV